MAKRFLLPGITVILLVLSFACKKDQFTTSSTDKLEFSQDSVLFDTVFTGIGSSTRHFRIRNTHDQKIKISSISLQGGSSSQFIINVDGISGTQFKDIEIAAKDSMYVFVQVNVDPNNQNSPLIITDKLVFITNGNSQEIILEAWGQDAYYHYPNRAIYFSDGTYLPFSTISNDEYAVVTWNKDKPHVIYGFLAVDSTQRLIINAGVRVYFNYKASLWIYRYGELKVKGEKGNEVIFQGARREKDYADEPGQWDRIWINEGSNNNEINYAIIKNGFIGIQTEVFGNTIGLPGRLKLTNTKIQNMSQWGIYSVAYEIYGGNNVISNCAEHSLNIELGGKYTFLHCTFSNFWEKSARDKPAINIKNYTDQQILPLDSCYFGNCIVDGKLEEETNIDVKSNATYTAQPFFSNSWLRTKTDISDLSRFLECRKSDSSLDYEDIANYNFETRDEEARIKGFIHPKSISDAGKFPLDINKISRSASISSGSISAGAYEK